MRSEKLLLECIIMTMRRDLVKLWILASRIREGFKSFEQRHAMSEDSGVLTP